MRALFSMLFGAGVALMTSRAEKSGAGVRTADIFTRRNMWLTLFGILHCYLIWQGDILYFYGVTALLFLFPFRHLKPRTLIWAGVVVLLFNSYFFEGRRYFDAVNKKESAESALAVRQSHQALNEHQLAAISAWQSTQEEHRPSEKHLYEDIANMQKG